MCGNNSEHKSCVDVLCFLHAKIESAQVRALDHWQASEHASQEQDQDH